MRRTWLPAPLLRLVFSLIFAGAAAASAVACSSSTSAADPAPSGVDGSTETEPEPGTDAAGPADGGTKDSSTNDSAPPAGEILGTLVSGACGVVKNQLAQATPTLENNVLVFVTGEKYVKSELSPGGQTLFDTPNAGGSSGESEVMSFEVLHYCEGATLLKTETQIAYNDAGAGKNSITDILVKIDGKPVGVSVTRAYKPPTQPAMTDADVKALLEKKLEGILESSARVQTADKWVKQILHVFSVNKAATDAIGRVWPTIDAVKRADTIVLVTQTTGGGFVYCNNSQMPPVGAECQ